MRELVLNREASTEQGTFGLLPLDEVALLTLELPWRDNARNVSCVPAGNYLCRARQSPRFGPVYELLEVPGRSDVLIHGGNLAGDVALGYRSDVQGCILLGLARGRLHGQEAVLDSHKAVTLFMKKMGGGDFTLRVQTPKPS